MICKENSKEDLNVMIVLLVYRSIIISTVSSNKFSTFRTNWKITFYMSAPLKLKFSSPAEKRHDRRQVILGGKL